MCRCEIDGVRESSSTRTNSDRRASYCFVVNGCTAHYRFSAEVDHMLVLKKQFPGVRNPGKMLNQRQNRSQVRQTKVISQRAHKNASTRIMKII